jgi:hypothetical protein
LSKSPPARKIQYESAFRRGNATSRAPIRSGTMKLKNIALSGMIARKIMVVPCIVKSALKACALTSVLFGTASCSRIRSASIPPSRKKAKALAP